MKRICDALANSPHKVHRLFFPGSKVFIIPYSHKFKTTTFLELLIYSVLHIQFVRSGRKVPVKLPRQYLKYFMVITTEQKNNGRYISNMQVPILFSNIIFNALQLFHSEFGY